jgi:AcrR family transcriptional regulator
MATSVRREGANRDHEIQEAALDLFLRKGYAGTSMQEIADAVGMGKASIYHYVAGKEDLLFRSLEQSHGEALRIVDAAEAHAGEPLRRLYVFVTGYVSYYLENIERVQVYQRERRYLQSPRWSAVHDRRHIYEAYVERLLAESRPPSSIAVRDCREITSFIFGAINGIPEWYRRGGASSTTEIAERYAAMACTAAGG